MLLRAALTRRCVRDSPHNVSSGSNWQSLRGSAPPAEANRLNLLRTPQTCVLPRYGQLRRNPAQACALTVASAVSRRERANATRAAATTGNEAGTEEDNRTPARTAPATKRDGNRTQQPDTGDAANRAPRDRPGPATKHWARRRTRDARRPEGVVILTLSLSES